MQLNKLSFYTLTLLQSGLLYAAEPDFVRLEAISSEAYDKKEEKNQPNIAIINKDRFESVTTLGDAIKHISGVQSSSFGPNSGGPVIRSLSGNRVGVYENGQSLNGMNSISGNIGIPFDPIFSQKITVDKSSDAVRYGGHAIGGSVNIDTGIISKEMEEKSHSIDIIMKKGFNNVDARGININVNNQKNLSTNIQYSRQEISSYKIPGRSKASICNSKLFPSTGGINSTLADACQKDASIQSTYHTGSQPYMNDYVLKQIENDPSIFWDNYDGLESAKYTNDAITERGGKTYHNTPNPNYVPNTPQYKQDKINKDITPDTNKKLWNSAFESTHFALGNTYFLDDGSYIGISLDRINSEYGVPGFAMDNFTFQKVYNSTPVNVKNEQNRYSIQSLFKTPYGLLDNVQFNATKNINKSGEYLGSTNANTYKFDTTSAELLLNHSAWDKLNGSLGFNFSTRDVTGFGNKRYLPDVKTDTRAVFFTEKFNWSLWLFEVGYRFEQVDHQVKDGSFDQSRNSPNGKLKDQDFDLHSYFTGIGFNPTDYLKFHVKYSDSSRAPEINELYASGLHFSEMVHEEGRQDLNKERSKSVEFTTQLNIANAMITGTAYQTKFDNYLYQTNSGMTTSANRVPLKYWTQGDTKITGFEIDTSYSFDFRNYGKFKVSAFADLVKNKLESSKSKVTNNDGVYFSNMPTNRYGASIEWNREDWTARLSSIYYEKAQYLGKNVNAEEPLPSYNLVDLYINKKVQLKNADLDLFLNGTNLLNDEARPQNSPLKYIAPLPGRGFQIGVTLHI